MSLSVSAIKLVSIYERRKEKKIKKALEDAIVNWVARTEGKEVDPCPVCIAMDGDCLGCPIGNGCHGTPLMDWLSGIGRTPENAQRAVDFLRNVLKEYEFGNS